MTIAMATMEQRMMGSINQPPALMISTTMDLRKRRRLLYHIRPGAVPETPRFPALQTRCFHLPRMAHAESHRSGQRSVVGYSTRQGIAFGHPRSRMSE